MNLEQMPVKNGRKQQHYHSKNRVQEKLNECKTLKDTLKDDEENKMLLDITSTWCKIEIEDSDGEESIDQNSSNESIDNIINECIEKDENKDKEKETQFIKSASLVKDQFRKIKE